METTIEPRRAERDESAQVHVWRLAQLRRGGFDPEDAALLAIHTEVDLHQALGLVERGCPPKTALQILLRSDATARLDPNYGKMPIRRAASYGCRARR